MGMAQRRGRAGETLTAAYFELLGCEVVGRNIELGGVEVDLVVADGATRVVVEVKLRTRADFGGAALAVGGPQRERLKRAARALGSGGAPVRIDVVALEPVDEGLSLRHYRNAITD